MATIGIALILGLAGTLAAVRAFAPPEVPRPATVLPQGAISFVHGSILAGPSIPDAEVYLMQPDGTGMHKLTDAAADGKVAAEPAWSPDGMRIAFVLSTPEHLGAYAGDGDIYVMNADGSRLTKLTDGLDAAAPAWSPDGTRIVFVRDQGNALMVINADGSDPTQIRPDGSAFPPYQGPAWSPDGTRIAFQASPLAGDDTNRVYVTGLDGSGTTAVTSGLSDGSPGWSPDGSTLAYAGSGGIHLLDLQTGSDGRLTRCDKPEDCGFDFQPSWAPDGSRIVFTRQDYAGDALQIFVVDADGTGLEQLTNGHGWNVEPSWQPLRSDGGSPSPTASVSPTSVPPVRVTEGKTLHLGQVGGLFAAQEAFGSLWAVVMDGGNEELVRADPTTGEVEHTFPLRNFPAAEWGGTGLVVGDGALWAAGAGPEFGRGIITRIDAATNAVQTIELDGRGVEDVVFDAGTVWALVPQDTRGDADVVAIDPSAVTVASTTAFHADWYGGIFPAGGSVWTVERDVKGADVLGGRLVQILPGDAPPITLGGSFAEPVSDGTSIWTPYFGSSEAMNVPRGIARIDPTNGEVLGAWKTDTVGYDLAVAEDGGIWFLAGTHLERLNPSAGETDVDITVDGTPIFIVPTHGAMWVGTYEGDLIRFDVADIAS